MTKDWSQTPVGEQAHWPKALQIALEAILGSAFPMAIWWGDALSMLYNDAYTSVLGENHGELLGESARTIWGEDALALEAIAEAVFSGSTYHDRDRKVYLRRDGVWEETYWSFSFSPLIDDQGAIGGILSVANEESYRLIQERKADEEILKEKEEKLRLAMDATGLGMWDFHPHKGLLYWSDTCKEIFGLPPEATIDYERFLKIVVEEDRESLRDYIEKVLQKGERYEVAYRITRVSDGEERWIKATGEVYTNEEGVPERLIGTAQDETERMLAEREKADFLRIAGHELRTPLTSVVGYLGLMQRLTQDQEQLRTLLDKCMRSTLKMRSLISDFLNISRMERGKLSHELKKVNLSAIARKVSDACSSEMPHHSLETDIEERIYIYGDEERLEQVIRNLLNNARKYSPKGETIYVDLRQQKGRVLFRVRDRGRGIDRKDVKKIFDRFYRGGVGARVSGMGLGLYIVKKIMDVHGGEIRVQTVPEKGSLFTLEFPVYPSEAGSEEV